MFDSCQPVGPRCSDVAEKLAQIFGWRHTYRVEKLQRSLAESVARNYQDQRKLPTLKYPQKDTQAADSWVAVHTLQSQSDGGILDPDDKLHDVADDREQIIANFEEDSEHPHHGGDGASGSSVGTSSPDIFQGPEHKYQHFAQTDIEVTDEQITAGLAPLQVRRGSEPALHQIGSGPTIITDPSKRWSAAPIIDDDAEKNAKNKDGKYVHIENGYLSCEWDGDEEKGKSAFTRFVRDSNRLSMQILGDSPNSYKWADAADRAISTHLASRVYLSQDGRKEPLGANSSSPIQPGDSDVEDELKSDNVEFVVMRNESGPLGIHVVPDYNRLGKDRGLLVQGIEPGGRIDRDGQLAVYDRIVEINGKSLLNIPFPRVQEIFKDALKAPELQLRVIKHRITIDHIKKPPPPVFPKSITKMHEDKENGMVEIEERLVGGNMKVATVSPTKKVPQPQAARSTNSLLTANTRKIGKKIEIELTKGSHGLGFSITTRDNPAGGNCPIYIKNILPKGAAVEDGRLRPGDRLLEVNGIEMTGKTQAEAVTVLRNTPPGGTVRLVVSRQEKGDESPRLPRQIVPPESMASEGTRYFNSSVPNVPYQPTGNHEKRVGHQLPFFEPPEKANDDGLTFPWKHREILTFDIPVHDTEKAGLGVSVKGKTSASNNGVSQDLGIFVKSVINGGAASRDGRLKTNDQLVNINGVSLLTKSNSEAMETLRKVMHQEGPTPGIITLTVARRVPSPTESYSGSGRDSANSLVTSSSGTETLGAKSESEGQTPDNSGASENSDNTVIFLPYNNKEVGSEESNLNTKSVSKIEDKDLGSLDGVALRNPVIDRLTGQNNALRNESYYRATHETWNTTMLMNVVDKLGSPTVNRPSGEMIMIEEEYVPHRLPPNSRVGKAENVLSGDRSDHEPDGRPSNQQNEKPGPPNGHEITYASQTSLEDAAAGFSRDAFGRQSMSEKRHAALDAKNTDTYQRNKRLREERERQRQLQLQQQQLNDQKRAEHESKQDSRAKYSKELIANTGLLVRANSAESIISITRSQTGSEKADGRSLELGPSLGMKKSSSLESLQTMVQEIQIQEDGDPAYTYRVQGPVKVIRGRGCNESFRAAVDRSYEAPLAELRNRMETLAEEEAEPMGNGFGRGTSRQSSLNAVLDDKYNKKGKKKTGLFKGIGSMFRFGKHRKTLEVPLHLGIEDGIVHEERESHHPDVEKEKERLAARQAAQDEQQRIQEQYRRLVQRQRQMEQQNNRSDSGSDCMSQGNGQGYQPGPSSIQGSMGPPGTGQTRTERIQQLRAQHQKRHAERQGQYPQDDREERYEERLEQPDILHMRSESYNLYGEMTRPGSRMGIADPAKYSHYVNYEEIQQHLNKRKEQLTEHQIKQMREQVHHQRLKVEGQSRRQQHYHSQRRDNREHHQRPVSNFYEYESVNMNTRSNHQQPQHVQQQQQKGSDTNSNSLPRQNHERNNIPHTKNNVGNNYIHHRLYQPSKGPAYQNNHRGIHSHDSYTTGYVRSTTNPGLFVTHTKVREATKPGPNV